MLNFIAENLATIAISILLAVGTAASIVHIIKLKKAGKSACGCSCKSCSMDCACKHNDQ